MHGYLHKQTESCIYEKIDGKMKKCLAKTATKQDPQVGIHWKQACACYHWQTVQAMSSARTCVCAPPPKGTQSTGDELALRLHTQYRSACHQSIQPVVCVDEEKQIIYSICLNTVFENNLGTHDKLVART